MRDKQKYRGSGDLPKLSEFFEVTEDAANRIRKLLRSRAQDLTLGDSGSVDGAVSIADLIERLCAHGKRLPAEEAIEIAEKVDRLIDQLWSEIVELLEPSQAGTYW